MKDKPMLINSLLDTDFYKFTMMQAVLHQYPNVNVRYSFKWRNWKDMNIKVSINDFAGRVKSEIRNLCTLHFANEELAYLSSIPYFKPDFIEYLRLFKLNRDHIRVYVEADELRISISGPWLNTILFEVPVLAIVSQTYTACSEDVDINWVQEAISRTDEKFSLIEKVPNFYFADFGTRRRASSYSQEYAIRTAIERTPDNFIGTSNVMFAMKYGVKAIGTMAHEYLQAHQQLGVRLFDSQAAALQSWANEYRGELGIALSDVWGFDAFLQDFDRYFALLFDGCRHDSGNPFKWGDRLISHYKKLRIDPMSKSAVFSDGLNFEDALELNKYFFGRIKHSFGIGTYLSNDCGFKAPQVVLKMVECNGAPVAKISDTKGKGMCDDEEFLTYLSSIIKRKIGG